MCGFCFCFFLITSSLGWRCFSLWHLFLFPHVDCWADCHAAISPLGGAVSPCTKDHFHTLLEIAMIIIITTIYLPVVANWSRNLPAVLRRIFHRSAEQSRLMHELFGNAADIDACAAKTPFGTCLEKRFQIICRRSPSISCLLIGEKRVPLRDGST